MLLNEIFARDIQRPIEGVIKADDTAHLGTEVEEYVLTNEAAKGLEDLLEAYTRYTNANGVWISGFFGSGKSHLLKMLAHLLGDVEGQDFDRAKVSESFREKSIGSFLPALLAKADRIPAKSLLFNIDQRASLISKDQRDALLKVFVKVFDESRGYYGNQGHVARFERDLDGRGQYEAFKAAYTRVSGRDWLRGREEGVLEEANVARAYAEVSGQVGEAAPRNILTKYRDEYSVSIDDFAEEVKAWIATQPEGFRLNFFIDEVGQFIGTDTQLMLDLQTIAESLNVKCQGQAWVFVTSQEDIDKVVGDRTKQQGNDFSKIQARFKTRVKLTSTDVEEVIRKRLLEKNAAGTNELESVYGQESANFRTLFDFVDGAKTYRNYTDQDHFVGTYPFVSYQFPLFQAAIEGISDHNAFEGRNSSVGERSMLGVVQQVAKDIGDVEVGRLATFDHMFAGIRASLKTAAQKQVLTAEGQLENPLAVRLLKALFLVKYVESFQATPRNLTVLMYDRFGLDLHALTEDVKQALTLLEAQTYIQRNGNVYEYLTNEEQVMEEEIKNVDIDASELSSRLFKILSADVIRGNRVRYAKNGQDFTYGFKLDDQAHGLQRELSLHFITPEYAYTADEIRMHSAGMDELRVVLAPDERTFADLRLLIKTDKYIKRKQSSSLTAIEDQILRSKAIQNVEREKELIQRLQSAVGHADLIINASDVTVTSVEAQSKVTDGLQELISRTYTQLKLLGGKTYSEQEVADAADPQDDLFEGKLTPAGEEVLGLVERKEKSGEQVTVKSLVDAFQSKPYGWDLASIEVVIASLIGASKVTLTLDGNTITRSEVAPILRNTQKHGHVVISQQKTYDTRKVAKLRKFYVDFFDDGNAPKDPPELARLAAQRLKDKRDELNSLVAVSKYPFVEQLNQPIELLDQVIGKADDWYLTEFNLADDLLDAKEDLIDPIQSFLQGQQRHIYDSASELLGANSSNLSYLPAGSDDAVRNGLADLNAFRGNKMTVLKNATDALSSQIRDVLQEKRSEATGAIEQRKEQLVSSDPFAQATAERKQAVSTRVDEILKQVKSQDQIALILQTASDFEANTYPALLDMLVLAEPGNAEAKKKTVSVKTITVPGATGLIETEEDVDRYLQAFRAALVQTLNNGKRISL